MAQVKALLKEIFEELNLRILELNRANRAEGLAIYPKAEILLLGQLSLSVDEKVVARLNLTQTADLDALLKAEFKIKDELKKILPRYGYVYDEDSPLIWIPPESKFVNLFLLDRITVKYLDAESVLLSKAIKAPKKNKVLIREALATNLFPSLADRILKHGGNLEDFL